MRTGNLAAIVATVVACWSMQTMAAESGGQAPTVDGRSLFARRCGICHFADGGGTWMLERRLGKGQALLESRTDLLAPYIRLITRRGLNGMPRFTRVELPDADLEVITAYLTRSGPRP
jgi:mono/diheme cytochrome c family protein